MNGDTTAAIFWAKTQMGWKETQVHEGDVTFNVITGVPRADD